MSENNAPVWVVAEQIAGEIPPVCLEIAGHARKLADQLDTPLEAILLGDEASHLVNLLFSLGIDTIHLGDAPGFATYQSEIFAECIVASAQERRPQIILLGSTFMGRELAPLLAARLGTGLTAHCIDLLLDENNVLQQQIPAYGGLMSIICPDKRPQIATVARGVFPTPELEEERSGRIQPVKFPEELDLRLRTLKVVHVETEGVPLETAAVVVAGGAGAGSHEGWLEIQELANALNAGFGSTRPAVDEGWTDLETMIGQSGKMVSPEVYIGVGLSGEQQHMVGISSAKLMIAVNNDPKSPVFEQVDFGIVEDCRVFIPALVDKLKQLEPHTRRAGNVV